MGTILLFLILIIGVLVVGSLVAGIIVHLIGWLIVGLIAGLLANYFMKGRPADLLNNLILGLAGSITSGFLLNIFHVGGLDNNLIGSVLFATLGAMLLIGVGRIFKSNNTVRTRY
jgi:uncharacterized membrane protein YeaQ/YmgE (transglycosylase-associated protein family)